MARDTRAPATNKAGRFVETTEYVKFMRRVARGMGKRVGRMDPEALAELAALVDEVRQVETEAAQALNAQGFSWADIGAAQGIVGNSAWKKYTQSSGVRSRKSARRVAG
jgi:hypothetical protein